MRKGRTIGLLVCLLTSILLGASPAAAEWVASGYGGINVSNGLSSVSMPEYGRRLVISDTTTFPNAGNPALATFNQTYKTSDLSLENAPVYGAKLGYFFTEEKFPWLGLELDAFTTKPDIKAQTVSTVQEINYFPVNTNFPCVVPGDCPVGVTRTGKLPISKSSFRVVTLALNLVARYPGKLFQPYLGVGVGMFYFKASGQFDGSQFAPGLNAIAGLKVLATREWGFFVEGKYNLAGVNNLDPTYGLSGTYTNLHVVGGVAYHF